jgi:hypothetical protein
MKGSQMGSLILFDQNGYWASNIPGDAFEQIGNLASQGHTLTCAAFTPAGGSLILYDQNGYWANNIPGDAFEQIGNLASQGHTLTCADFT